LIFRDVREHPWLEVRWPMNFEDLSFEPGKKVSGKVSVAQRSLSSIDVPVTVIHGTQKGPHLCVIAGEHANEYAGIEAAIRLGREIAPGQIRGTLSLLPVVNVPGFENRTPYVNPIDRVNVVKSWPGKPTGGTLTDVITHALFEEIIAKCNYLISLHGGDICESMIPCSYFWNTGREEVDRMAERMAGLFETEYAIEYSYVNKLAFETSRLGAPKIIVEAGGEGKLAEKDVRMLIRGVQNVMKDLEMMAGTPIREVRPKIIRGKDKLIYVGSAKAGLFYSKVEIGDWVSPGKIIGMIKDYQGNLIEEIRSPIHGKIFFKINPLPWDPDLGWFLFQIVDTGEK
jgi:uncharacterized protein